MPRRDNPAHSAAGPPRTGDVVANPPRPVATGTVGVARGSAHGSGCRSDQFGPESIDRGQAIDLLLHRLRETDSVTATLEEWMGLGPIRIELSQRTARPLSHSEIGYLRASGPCQCQERRGTLVTGKPRIPLADTSALGLVGRVPATVMSALDRTDTPLGTLLRDHQMTREIINISVVGESDLIGSAPIISITAVVRLGGVPAIVVYENIHAAVLDHVVRRHSHLPEHSSTAPALAVP